MTVQQCTMGKLKNGVKSSQLGGKHAKKLLGVVSQVKIGLNKPLAKRILNKHPQIAKTLPEAQRTQKLTP